MNMMALLQEAPKLAEAAADGGATSPAGAIIAGIAGLVVIAATWRLFTKAGEPGWAVLVPIYNIVTLLRVAGKPLWWMVLLLLPVANVFAAYYVSVGVAARFGKGTGFAIGMVLLPFIFYPLLAFGDARYENVPATA